MKPQKGIAKSRKSTGARKPDARQAAQGTHVWRMTFHSGYLPDGFHSYTEGLPQRQVAILPNQKEAVAEVKRAVGMDVGIGWGEVKEGGDLEVEEEEDCYKIVWSPPDSEVVTVEALRVYVTGKQWVVEVRECGCNSRLENEGSVEGEVLGPYGSRQRAVEEGRRKMRRVYGNSWAGLRGRVRMVCDVEEEFEERCDVGREMKCSVKVRVLGEGESVSFVRNVDDGADDDEDDEGGDEEDEEGEEANFRGSDWGSSMFFVKAH